MTYPLIKNKLMKKNVILLLLLFAGAQHSAAFDAAAASDTTNVYVVNGEKCPSFSGAELVGKTVEAYKILYATKGESVVALHQITTKEKGPKSVRKIVVHRDSVVVHSDSKGVHSDSKVILLNGKEVEPKKIAFIEQNDITNVTVFKAGSESSIKSFGERGKTHTFICIETKKK